MHLVLLMVYFGWVWYGSLSDGTFLLNWSGWFLWSILGGMLYVYKRDWFVGYEEVFDGRS